MFSVTLIHAIYIFLKPSIANGFAPFTWHDGSKVSDGFKNWNNGKPDYNPVKLNVGQVFTGKLSEDSA